MNILPMLLVCFGDITGPEATQAVARAMVANLSHKVSSSCPRSCVAWTTTSGAPRKDPRNSSAMSALPGSSSARLPQRRTLVDERSAIDTHPKVVDAATQALKSVGDVILNPRLSL